MTKPAERREGAIAFLDILGFRGVWTRIPADEVLKKMRFITDFVKNALAEPEFADHYRNASLTVISDTIVVEFAGPRVDAALAVGEILQRLFFPFLAEGLPLRGAVAAGSYYRDERTFIGEAVDDASAWYEQSEWIGAILTPSATLALDGASSRKPPEHLKVRDMIWRKYPVPTKANSPVLLYALNWPDNVDRRISDQRDRVGYTTYGLIAGALGELGPISPSVVSKYANTMEFVEWCLEKGKLVEPDRSTDAEQQGGGYSPPAAQSAQPTP